MLPFSISPRNAVGRGPRPNQRQGQAEPRVSGADPSQGCPPMTRPRRRGIALLLVERPYKNTRGLASPLFPSFPRLAKTSNPREPDSSALTTFFFF